MAWHSIEAVTLAIWCMYWDGISGMGGVEQLDSASAPVGGCRVVVLMSIVHGHEVSSKGSFFSVLQR